MFIEIGANDASQSYNLQKNLSLEYDWELTVHLICPAISFIL
jgi:hypothetical protein